MHSALVPIWQQQATAVGVLIQRSLLIPRSQPYDLCSNVYHLPVHCVCVIQGQCAHHGWWWRGENAEVGHRWVALTDRVNLFNSTSVWLRAPIGP
jgi:hypothetical protein